MGTQEDVAKAAAQGVTNALINAGKPPAEVGAAAAAAAKEAGGSQSQQAISAGLGAGFAAKQQGKSDDQIVVEIKNAVTAAGVSFADGAAAVQQYTADPNRWDR